MEQLIEGESRRENERKRKEIIVRKEEKKKKEKTVIDQRRGKWIELVMLVKIEEKLILRD